MKISGSVALCDDVEGSTRKKKKKSATSITAKDGDESGITAEASKNTGEGKKKKRKNHHQNEELPIQLSADGDIANKEKKKTKEAKKKKDVGGTNSGAVPDMAGGSSLDSSNDKMQKKKRKHKEGDVTVAKRPKPEISAPNEEATGDRGSTNDVKAQKPKSLTKKPNDTDTNNGDASIKQKRNRRGRKRKGGGDGGKGVDKGKKVFESLLSEDLRATEGGSNNNTQVDVTANDADIMFATEHWDKDDPTTDNTVKSVVPDAKPIKKKKKQKVQKEVAAADAEKDKKSSKTQALSYLKLWEKDRGNWSFKKVKQIWLIKNMYDPKMIKDKKFAVLLDYLSAAKGSARKQLVEKAEAIFANMDKDKQDDGKEDEDNSQKQKPSPVLVERAKQVLQMVSE